MRLATIRTGAGTAAVRVDAEEAVEVGAPDVGTLLAVPRWRMVAGDASGRAHPVAGLDYAPLVPRPPKIICVGLNYRSHILEMGGQLPEYPTLFAKYARALVGAHDDIVLPAVSSQMDWEAELGVVIGAVTRQATMSGAGAAIAGYTVVNDVTARDWQSRTLQWLQGKTFEATTPLGPHLVTADEMPPGGTELSCEIDGVLVQKASTADLVFDPAALVCYVSAIMTLEPGDVIATGTPGGVGHARTPPRYLEDGTTVVTRVAGVGECRNRCRRERAGEQTAPGGGAAVGHAEPPGSAPAP